MPVAALLGIGNSLFHVWGGKQVALTTGNDIRALGVFVSTGAMGLAIGMVFFSWMLLSLFLIALCVLAAFYLHIDARKASLAHLSDDQNARSFSQMFILLSVLALMGVVALRAHLGTAFSSPFGRTADVVLLIGLVSMLGKMSGGWLVHLLGMVPAVGVMLLAVVGCLLFRHAGHYVLLLGLLAVNLTMPVTLYFANVVLKGHEGLAFGLLAAALVPSSRRRFLPLRPSSVLRHLLTMISPSTPTRGYCVASSILCSKMLRRIPRLVWSPCVVPPTPLICCCKWKTQVVVFLPTRQNISLSVL